MLKLKLSRRAGLGEPSPHVLHLQSLDRLPVEAQFLGDVLDGGLPGSRAARASRARNSCTARTALRSPGGNSAGKLRDRPRFSDARCLPQAGQTRLRLITMTTHGERWSLS
jgi:hypothetical protein